MTDLKDAYDIIEASPRLTELDDQLTQKIFVPIRNQEVAPRKKYFVTDSDDGSARLAITGNKAYTEKQEVFLDYRPQGKGLLLRVAGDFMPGNPRFKKIENAQSKTVCYETLITDVADIDDELIGWVNASYESFVPEDIRTLEEKKEDWKKLNRQCLVEAFQRDEWAAHHGYEAIALATVVFGKDSIELADSNKNMALVYLYQGYPDSAIKFSKIAYPLAEKLLNDHFKTASEILHQHAAVLHANKEFAGAEALYKHVLKLRKEAKGTNRSTIAQSLGDLARLYADTDRKPEAEKTNLQCATIYQEIMDDCKDKKSDEYYSALYSHTTVRSNIAMRLRMDKQYDKAAETYTSLADALMAIVSLGGQPQESLLKNIHGNILRLEEEYAESKPKLEAAKEKIEKIIPPDTRSEYWQAIDYLLDEFGREKK